MDDRHLNCDDVALRKSLHLGPEQLRVDVPMSEVPIPAEEEQRTIRYRKK